MKTFSELWSFIQTRPGVITVQNKKELEYIYNLMVECDCESYLEIGTAEGNSLYVLGHAVKDNITWVDFGEKHTESPRSHVEGWLAHKQIKGIIGDSTSRQTYYKVFNPNYFTQFSCKYDCVLIDGGHDYTTVLSDAILYAPLATKYVFFHDVQMKEVKAAVDWFVKRWDLGEYSEFINSDTFGFGIIKVRQ